MVGTSGMTTDARTPKRSALDDLREAERRLIDIRARAATYRNRLAKIVEQARALGVKVPAKIDEKNAAIVAKMIEDASTERMEKAEDLSARITSTISEIDKAISKADSAADDARGEE